MTDISRPLRPATRPVPPALQFFDSSQAPYLTDEKIARKIEFPDAIRDRVNTDAYFLGMMDVKPLVLDKDTDRSSLVEYTFAPNFKVPRHHHDTDQIILVLEGEIYLGAHRVGAGCGYFTASGAPYALVTGEQGCRFVEFRPSTGFATIYEEAKPERWERLSEADDASSNPSRATKH